MTDDKIVSLNGKRKPDTTRLSEDQRSMFNLMLMLITADAGNARVGLVSGKLNGKNTSILAIISRHYDEATGEEYTTIEPLGTLANVGDVFMLHDASMGPMVYTQEAAQRFIDLAKMYGVHEGHETGIPEFDNQFVGSAANDRDKKEDK